MQEPGRGEHCEKDFGDRFVFEHSIQFYLC